MNFPLRPAPAARHETRPQGLVAVIEAPRAVLTVEILAARKEAVFDETYDQFLEGLTKILNEKLYDSIIMIHDPEVTTKTFFDVEF